MTVFRTYINFREETPDLEQNDGKSLTQPDQTMSLQELLDQHSRGIQIPTFGSDYSEEEDGFMLPNMKALDLTEAMDLAERHRESIDHQLKMYNLDHELNPIKPVDPLPDPPKPDDREQKQD